MFLVFGAQSSARPSIQLRLSKGAVFVVRRGLPFARQKIQLLQSCSNSYWQKKIGVYFYNFILQIYGRLLNIKLF